ncbi:hypothetical protein PG994_013560 [Apiospora phragmitis]|uniref:Peptidase C15, pyroglutamyl peptidase I-like protein n=1 Tax=Apiospora phragmitis TaxID=2905665 RepID=A0ABR1T905_9PEZI
MFKRTEEKLNEQIQPYPDGHGGQIGPNTSYTLTQMMPPVLEPHTAQNPSATRIRIARPRTGYVPTEYRAIRQFCHDLHHHHDSNKDDDGGRKETETETALFVHLGEARGLWDHHVTIERCAFKQGMTSDFWGAVGGAPRGDRKYYTVPDAVGEVVDDLGPCPWGADVPVGLRTALDVDAVADKARGILRMCSQFSSNSSRGGGGGGNRAAEAEEDRDNGPLGILPHLEAGFYGCGFIYYESLANCYVKQQQLEGRYNKPNVLFCHVPGKEDARSLVRARDAVLAVIVAAVDEVLRAGGA